MAAKLTANAGYRSGLEHLAFQGLANAIPQALYENVNTPSTELVNSWINPSSVTSGLASSYSQSVTGSTSLLSALLFTSSKFSLYPVAMDSATRVLPFASFGLLHSRGLQVESDAAPAQAVQGFPCGLIASVELSTTTTQHAVTTSTQDLSGARPMSLADVVAEAADRYVRSSWKSMTMSQDGVSSASSYDISKGLNFFSGAMLGDHYYGAGRYNSDLPLIAELEFSTKTSESLTANTSEGLDLITQPTSAV